MSKIESCQPRIYLERRHVKQRGGAVLVAVSARLSRSSREHCCLHRLVARWLSVLQRDLNLNIKPNLNFNAPAAGGAAARPGRGGGGGPAAGAAPPGGVEV